MIFLYNEDAGKETLKLRGEDYKYLIKVRRHKKGETLHLRNENDPHTLHTYTISDVTPRELFLELQNSEDKTVIPLKKLHIGWCMIDPKSIEKALPSLNENRCLQNKLHLLRTESKELQARFKAFASHFALLQPAVWTQRFYGVCYLQPPRRLFKRLSRC